MGNTTFCKCEKMQRQAFQHIGSLDYNATMVLYQSKMHLTWLYGLAFLWLPEIPKTCLHKICHILGIFLSV